MPRGRRSQKLSPEHIARLKKFQNHHAYSVPQLKAAMGEGAPFKWGVLQRAIDGGAVWELSYEYIVQWLDRYVPVPPAPRAALDGKSRAAGEQEEENNHAS
jgi:hypothetical protein